MSKAKLLPAPRRSFGITLNEAEDQNPIPLRRRANQSSANLCTIFETPSERMWGIKINGKSDNFSALDYTRSTLPTSTTTTEESPIPDNEAIWLKLPITPKARFGIRLKSPSKPMSTRASSHSPTRSLQFRFDAEKPKNSLFPMGKDTAISLYQQILTENERAEIKKYELIYYLNTENQKRMESYTDEKGCYKAEKGEHIAYRYEIHEILGEGTFGLVVKCFDHKECEYAAIKIYKKPYAFRKIGEIEKSILKDLGKDDIDDSKCILKSKESFLFRGHLCISMELMSLNLYEFLKKNDFRGIDMNLIRRIAVQLLIGIKYVHSKGYIHCDIKPENIVLRSENKSSIKIIDFGSSSREGGNLCTYLQSRFYRAPEILLGNRYNHQIDIWSLGCVLAELCLGIPLFPGENQYECFVRIMATLGTPPINLIEKAYAKSDYFDQNNLPIIKENSNRETFIPGSRPLAEIFEGCDYKFITFLERCLTWDPKNRITAEEGLLHDWIKGDANKRSLLISRRATSGVDIRRNKQKL
ncbi:unnamed protein product [Blepharisma stoltei]|uniref:dual-specificity kinase n=1 Tax=Blepharisma stoltei TaxID=1481888 RepID=A0AAU9JUR2_9CILI|nr:unnamed protein product [Blepharisma stoltei]